MICITIGNIIVRESRLSSPYGLHLSPDKYTKIHAQTCDKTSNLSMAHDQINKYNLAVFLATILLTFSSGVRANATGEQVIAGQAGFTRNGSDLIITQGSQRVIINWQDFSNANGELTKFIQPNSSSAALNRVVSGNLSSLLGDLEANGKIYLINPNGIVIGADANINTQSFIASTLDVSNAEFMNGGDLNFVGDSQNIIENLGTINGGNGDVFLIAKHVDNSGTIKADGHVGIAGGNDVLLKASGDDRLAVRVTDKDGRVDQKGLIEAAKIELKTAGNNPYALAINHEGISRATSAVNKEGRIILFAEGGTTKVDGMLDASAPIDGDGGFIETSGTHVEIADTIKIDTSSKTGETGTWLIDPEQIEINSVATIGGASLITASSIETNLDTTNVAITSNNALSGNGNITVNESITSASSNSLTMNAGSGGSIRVNESISIDGNITLIAGNGKDGANGADASYNGSSPLASTGATDGQAGQRGGDVQVNAALISHSGNVLLQGGHGGVGGAGGDGTENGTNNAAFDYVLGGGDSGDGGDGGLVMVNGMIEAGGTVSLLGGNGGMPLQGGTGLENPYTTDARNAGDGGDGGDGGAVSVAANINASHLVIRGGTAAYGGWGGFVYKVQDGGLMAFSGDGGDGGLGGYVFLNTDEFNIMSADIRGGMLDTRSGFSGGFYGAFYGSVGNASGGSGGNGGSAGEIVLQQALSLNGSGDFNFTTSAGGLGFPGKSGAGTGTDGSDGTNGNDANISLLSYSITTNGNLNLNSGGGISGTGTLTAVNINLTANGTDAAIGSAAQAINTNASGTITASASNGTGGIYIAQQGDFDISAHSFNAGTGDLGLTAVDGNLTSGATAFNFTGANLTLTTTEDASNNTAGDRNISIGSGGISAANTNLTLTSADDVIVDGTVTASSFTATAGDGKQGSTGSIGGGAHFSFPGGAGGVGERGGNVAFNASAAILFGDLRITAGSGGQGGSGGYGGVNGFDHGTRGGSGGAGNTGGNISLMDVTVANDLVLMAGIGGQGGTGGAGGNGGNSGGIAGQGGNGSVGGNITLADAVVGNDLMLLAGVGGKGGTGGKGGDKAPTTGYAASPGAVGGTGGVGGNISLSEVAVSNTLLVTAGAGGQGGTGGRGGSNKSSGFAATGSGGDGSVGGEASLSGAIVVDDDATFTSGFAGAAGAGGASGLVGAEGNLNLNAFLTSTNGDITLVASSGAAAAGHLSGNQISAKALAGSINISGEIIPDAGSSVSLLAGTASGQILNFTTAQDLNLTGPGNLSLQGYGFNSSNNFSTVDGDISINSGDGALDLAGTVTATNGYVNLTSVGNLTATQLITGNNISLIASGLNAAIGSTGNGIETNAAGIITATASNGTGGIYLHNQGNLLLNNFNSGTGDLQLTANEGTITSNAASYSFAGANLSLTTTEDAGNNTAGDRNIQIGSGGINATNTNLTLTSADDVIIDGAITAASVTATAGDGKKGADSMVISGTGLDGERGGDITINQSITSHVGDVVLTSGKGGEGGIGGAGLDGLGAFPGETGGTGSSGGKGGEGGIGGAVRVNQAITGQVGDVSITTGEGGVGGRGGNAGSGGSCIIPHGGDCIGGVGGSGGLGGLGAIGGELIVNGVISSNTAGVTLIAGDGGIGGDGGVGGNGGQSTGVADGGNGGNGGVGGDGGLGGLASVNLTISGATNAVIISAGSGGTGGTGGLPGVGGSAEDAFSLGGSGGTIGVDGNGGDGESLRLFAPIHSSAANIILTAGVGGAGLVTGGAGSVSGDQIDATATNGSITVTGAINADAGSSVSLLAGTASDQLLTFNTVQDFNLTDSGSLSLRGFGFSSSNNFSTQDGDISIDSGASDITLSGTVNSGNGDLAVTAGGFFNISNVLQGNDITLTHTGNPNTSGILKTGNVAVEIQATGKLNVDTSNGSRAKIIQHGDLQIGTLTGGNSFGLSGGTSGIELTVQDGDLTMDSTSSITKYNNIAFTAHNGSIDTGTALITVASRETSTGPSTTEINPGTITLTTTEDATNNTAGDHNITIGSGGINNGSIALSSTDDVVVNGAINSDSFSAATGDGVDAVFVSGQNGNDGERGGNIVINSGIQTNAGVISLTAGKGGDGSSTDLDGGVAGHGGNGGSITVNSALTANQDLTQSVLGAITLTTGSGGFGSTVITTNGTAGNGGQGGDLNINADLTSNIDISLRAGNGEQGGAGSDVAGVGGVGGNGGNIDVQGKLSAQQDISVTSGSGGIGGLGTTGANTNGTGGVGGNAGNITLRDTLTAQRDISLRTNSGGDGGDAGSSGVNPATFGPGGNGGNGGVMDLRATITAQRDVQLTNDVVSQGGTGNVDGTVGNRGQIVGSLINATASTGALTLDGVINANANVDLQLVAGTDLTLKRGSVINATGSGNIILAATGDFHNDSGEFDLIGNPLTSTPLTVDSGRYVIYSTRPDNNRDDIGNDFNAITHDFVQYNTTFDSSSPLPASLPAGNGFVYSVQPVLTGVTVSVNPQTINYGETISSILNTDFTVGGGAGASYEVGSVAVTAADFELADAATVTINDTDVELNLANTVSISNADFAAAGSYTDGIQAGVIAGSALAQQGVALSGSGDLTVNKRDLNVTLVADNKVYDATDIASLSLGADDRLSGDLLSIDAGTSTFDDKNVGTGKTVTVVGTSLSGADAGNYNFVISNPGTLTADISKADLIVNSAVAQDKVYDASTAVIVTGGSVTALLTDIVNLNLDSANFADKNAANNKAVIANYSISGNDANNYNLIQPTGLTADISQRTLNATLTANDKVYDATIAATGGFTDDRVTGDNLNINGVLNFNTKNVGTNVVTATGLNLTGNDAANYVLASSNLNDAADITPAPLNIIANNDSKVFDSIAYTGGNGVSYAGFVGTEDQSVLNGSLFYTGTSQGAVNPGSYAITPDGLTATNYAITFVDGGLTISPAGGGSGGSNSGSSSNSGGSNSPAGTFNNFQSQQNNGVNIPNTNGNNFVPPGSGGGSLFPLRQGINNQSTPFSFMSWNASRHFQTGENNNDDDE